MAKDKNQQANPNRLGDAIKTTPLVGKSPERWASEVWDKATKAKGGK